MKEGPATLRMRHSLHREILRMKKRVLPSSREVLRAGSRVSTCAAGTNPRDRWVSLWRGAKLHKHQHSHNTHPSRRLNRNGLGRRPAAFVQTYDTVRAVVRGSPLGPPLIKRLSKERHCPIAAPTSTLSFQNQATNDRDGQGRGSWHRKSRSGREQWGKKNPQSSPAGFSWKSYGCRSTTGWRWAESAYHGTLSAYGEVCPA